MPLFLWLATVLGSLFTGLVQFFMNYMTKKIAIVLAVVAAIASLTIGFFTWVLALVTGLLVVVPSEVSVAISWVVPTNAYFCFSLILTAHTIRWVYEWNIKVIQFRLF